MPHFWGCAPWDGLWMTPKFKLSRDFCIMHLYPQVSSSCVYSFGSNRVDKHTNTQTNADETIQRSSLRWVALCHCRRSIQWRSYKHANRLGFPSVFYERLTTSRISVGKFQQSVSAYKTVEVLTSVRDYYKSCTITVWNGRKQLVRKFGIQHGRETVSWQVRQYFAGGTRFGILTHYRSTVEKELAQTSRVLFLAHDACLAYAMSMASVCPSVCNVGDCDHTV